MDPQTIKAILAIGSIVFIGFFGNLIFVRFRVPDVLILVALGMMIGPDILGKTIGLVTNDMLSGINKYQDLLLSAALILILFDGGLSLDVRTVIQSMKISTFIIVLTLLSEITIVALALHFFMHMDLLLALVVGAIVGGTGEAVVIPIANRLRVKPQTKSMLVMESVITDVCVIVIALTLMQVIVLGDFSLVSLARELAMKFLFGAAFGFAAGVAWLFVLQRLQNQPLSYMITMGALLLVAGFVELSPMRSSAAVAALAFGLAVGNRKFVKRWLTSVSLRLSSDEHIHQFHSEISFFVRTFFYVYLGLMFRFSTFTALHLIIGISIIGIIVVVRRATSMIAWKVGDMDRSDANALFSLMPRGLAAAVLATLPAALLTATSVWKSEYNPLILNVALIVILGTTILTTVLSYLVERTIDQQNRKLLRRKLTEPESA
jgi:cell volume regulation protein A